MTPADGGAALPAHDGFGDPTNGMSLRDWFAGQALAGLMAANLSADSPENWALASYTMADAMLAERAK